MEKETPNIPNWTIVYYAHNHHTPAYLMIPTSGCHHSGKEDFPKHTPYRMEEHLLIFTVSQSLAAFEKSLVISAPPVSFAVAPMKVTFQTFLSFFIMCIISHILLCIVKHKSLCCLVIKLCPTLLQLRGLQPARLLYPWDFPSKNTRVGCHLPLQ